MSYYGSGDIGSGGGGGGGSGSLSQTTIVEQQLRSGGGGGLDAGANGLPRLSYGLNHHAHHQTGPSVSSPTPASTASLYGRPGPFHGYLPGVVDVFERLDAGNGLPGGTPYRSGNPFSQLGGSCGGGGPGGGGGVGGSGLALSPGASTPAVPNGAALTGPGFRDYHLSPSGTSSSGDGYGNGVGGGSGLGGDYCNGGSGVTTPSTQVYPWMTIVGE